MQVKSEPDPDVVLPSNVAHTSGGVKMEAAAVPITAPLPIVAPLPIAVIVPVLAPGIIIDSAAGFVSCLPDILKAKDFERLVSGIKIFAHKADVLDATLNQLAYYQHNLTNADKQKLSKTGVPYFIDTLVALVQGNPQLRQIQRNGLVILTCMCLSPETDFVSHLRIPIATMALRNMAVYPKDMYIQKTACVALDLICQQIQDAEVLASITTAGGFDLVELLLAFSRTVCLTPIEAAVFGLNDNHFLKSLVSQKGQNSTGTLCTIFSLLARFAGNWTAAPEQEQVATPTSGIEDGIVRIMRAFANIPTLQERGCVVLGRLANRNITRFNQTDMKCLCTVLRIMQTASLTNTVHDVVCHTLQSFIGVENITTAETADINKKMQCNMGYTGVIPLVLRGIKFHYDLNNSKSNMLDHLQCHINLLVALVVGNAENCRRVYSADGVTLLVAVLVSRRQKNISQIETSCIQALCYIFTHTKTLHADVYSSLLVSAGIVKHCRTTNPANRKKPASSAIDAVVTTMSKSAVPGVVRHACLCMLSACAQDPKRLDSLGVVCKTVAVKILKPNQRVVEKNVSVIAEAMRLLAILTERGTFINDAEVRLIASLTPFPAEANHQVYMDALTKLRLQLGAGMQVGAKRQATDAPSATAKRIPQ